MCVLSAHTYDTSTLTYFHTLPQRVYNHGEPGLWRPGDFCDPNLSRAGGGRRCRQPGTDAPGADRPAAEIDHAPTGARPSSTSAGVPDIVFLDINLPDMRGWDILDRFKTDARLTDLQVIVLTSHHEPVHRPHRHAAAHRRLPAQASGSRNPAPTCTGVSEPVMAAPVPAKQAPAARRVITAARRPWAFGVCRPRAGGGHCAAVAGAPSRSCAPSPRPLRLAQAATAAEDYPAAADALAGRRRPPALTTAISTTAPAWPRYRPGALRRPSATWRRPRRWTAGPPPGAWRWATPTPAWATPRPRATQWELALAETPRRRHPAGAAGQQLRGRRPVSRGHRDADRAGARARRRHQRVLPAGAADGRHRAGRGAVAAGAGGRFCARIDASNLAADGGD